MNQEEKDQQKYQAELEAERLEQERNYQREKNTQELASQAREQQQKEELRRLELQLKKEEQRQLELALEKEKEIILNAAKFKKLNFQDFCNKFFDKSLENIMVCISYRDFNCFVDSDLGSICRPADENSSNLYTALGIHSRKLTELFSSYPQGKFNLFKWVKNRPKVSPQEEETYKDLVFVPTRGLVPVSHYPYGQKYYPVYLSEKPYLQYTNDQRFLASLLGNNHFTIEEMKQILTSKCSSIEMIIEQLEILKSQENI